MSIHVSLTGVDEIKAWLQKLPAHLTEEAAQIVFQHADVAASSIKASYKRSDRVRGSHLADAVEVEKDVSFSRFAAFAVVSNRHPISHIYEHGSAARYYKGAPRGSAPARNNFIPRAIAARRNMYEALKQMLAREGFEVRGSIGGTAD